VHSDHLNAPRKVAQPTTGTLAWRWDTDPFGTATPNQNPGGLGTFVYNLRAPGQYYQAETGLNQNWNRDYDPLGGGRYVESDLIGIAGGLNTYAYVLDDPLSYYDTDGLCGTKTCVGKACILKGNAKLIGRQGAFPNTSIAANTAAVIPDQFGFSSAAQMTPYIGQISGTTSNGLSINGVSDVVGGKSPIPGTPVRTALEQIYPGLLILELPSAAKDGGIVDITLTIPDNLQCPTGLVEKK
jgi:RHS repeat-associated protein